jgi:PAS domain-containing protein
LTRAVRTSIYRNLGLLFNVIHKKRHGLRPAVSSAEIFLDLEHGTSTLLKDNELPASYRVLSRLAMPHLNAEVLSEYAVVVDTSRRYAEVPDRFCKLLGYRRDELVGKRYDVDRAEK